MDNNPLQGQQYQPQPNEPQPIASQPPVPPVQPAQSATPPPTPVVSPAAPVPQATAWQQPNQQAAAPQEENPNKSYIAATLLSIFLGGLAIDRFYLGYIGTGIVKLITGGGFGIWQLIDLLRIAFGNLKAKNDPRPLQGYAHHKKALQPISVILVVLSLLVVPFILLIVFLAVPNLQHNSQSTQAKTDTFAVYTALNSYATSHQGQYPTDSQFQSGDFQFPVLNSGAKPSDFSYQAQPVGCDNQATSCGSFVLTRTLTDGQTFTLKP